MSRLCIEIMENWLDKYNDDISSAQKGKTLYVSSEDDSRYKSYKDSLYNYNIGNKLQNRIKDVEDMVPIKKGSKHDQLIQKKLKENRGKGLLDTSNDKRADPGIRNIMQHYQKYGNKSIMPIRYNSYMSDPDNAAWDLVNGRAFTDAVGITDERVGGYNLPQWKKPEQLVMIKKQQKNAYKDSLELYNKGEANKKRLQKTNKTNTYPYNKSDNLKETSPEAYKNYKRTGIMSVMETTGELKKGVQPFIIEYKKPTPPKAVEKPVIRTKSSAKSIDNYLQPIGIENDVIIDADVPDHISTSARIPKYYSITDKYQTPTGEGQTDYKVENIDELRELPKEGWNRKITPQYQEGGVIKDDRGQWAHPGKVTQINSKFITMKDVPYPVLGVSDMGDSKIMYPEEDYEFIGNNVTEYPMAQNGKKLANFTRSGNWLSKYE